MNRTSPARKYLCVDQHWELAVIVAGIHDSLEYEVLAIILCSPASGVKLARGCGVTAALFLAEDLQLIYAATVEAVRVGKPADALWFAKSALIQHDWPYGPGRRWADDELNHLGESFATFATPLQRRWMPIVARKLLAAHQAILQMDRNTRDTLARLRGVLRKGRAA